MINIVFNQISCQYHLLVSENIHTLFILCAVPIWDNLGSCLTHLVIFYVAHNVLLTILKWTENCTCSRRETTHRTIDFFKISASRTELRCNMCNGLVGWWDEPTRIKKIMPVKRTWTEDECMAMR